MRSVFKIFLLSLSICFTAFCLSAETDFYSPLAVKRAKDAVFQISHSLGRSSGFFIENQKTFLTTFHFIYDLAKTSPYKSFVDSIIISKEELRFKVKKVKSLSALNNLALLEVEGYEGYFLNLSQNPFHVDQDMYAVKTSSQKEDRALQLTKARRVMRTSPSQFNFISPIQNTEDGAGSPVLNHEGQVIGMIESADSHIISAVCKQPIQYLIRQASNENNHLPEETQIENTLIDLQIRAYDQENTSAQIRMGLILAEEKKSHAEAISLLRSAVLKENTLAQFHLGSFLFSGELGRLDKKQGFHLLEKAAQSGYAPAQFQIGAALLEKGTLRDVHKSFFWLKKAAELGHNEARHYISEMFYLGVGTHPDLGQSHFWLDKHQ